MATLLTTITYGDILIQIYGEEIDGVGVKLSYQSVQADANGDPILVGGEPVPVTSGFDIAGLFFDKDNDGGDLKSAKDDGYGKEGGGLNLNGTDSLTGEKLDGWDNIFMTSSPGLKGEDPDMSGDGDLNGDAMILSGLTFADLAGGQFGVKLQSVDDLNGGSLKLTGTVPNDFDPGDEPEPDDDFPTWPQDISHIVLYFQQEAGDTNGDGFYTISIGPSDEPGDEYSGSKNLDDDIGQILEWLKINDQYIDDDSQLLGVVIKGGNVAESTKYFAYGDNDPSSDPVPDGAPQIEYPPTQGNVKDGIDATYHDNDVFGIA